MFMHNGGIGNWAQVKRPLASSLADQWFMGVQGNTDSEWCFALFLDCMERLGHSPNNDPGPTGFGHAVLRKALLWAIERINEFSCAIPERERNEDSRGLLNFAVTDGHSVICTRYVSSTTDEAASLFFSSGTSWKEQQGNGTKSGDYRMERRDKAGDIVLVASEPLTFERGKKRCPTALQM